MSEESILSLSDEGDHPFAVRVILGLSSAAVGAFLFWFIYKRGRNLPRNVCFCHYD